MGNILPATESQARPQKCPLPPPGASYSGLRLPLTGPQVPGREKRVKLCAFLVPIMNVMRHSAIFSPAKVYDQESAITRPNSPARLATGAFCPAAQVAGRARTCSPPATRARRSCPTRRPSGTQSAVLPRRHSGRQDDRHPPAYPHAFCYPHVDYTAPCNQSQARDIRHSPRGGFICCETRISGTPPCYPRARRLYDLN